MDNPLVPAGLVGLVALLGGYGFYRMRQRKAAAQADSSFLESRVQPDSFFGSSGGQHVDTNDESPPSGNGSSLNYSPASSTPAATSIRWPRPTCTWPMGETCRPRKSSRKP